MNMKAVYLVGKGRLRIEEVPVPEIRGDDDVLVRIRSVGICGSDIHYFREGRIGDQVVGERIILGHEAAGDVVQVGRCVRNVRPGDRVAIEPGISCLSCEACRAGRPNLCPGVRFLGTPPVDGAFREFIVMPSENLYAIPEGLGYDEGVLAEPLAIGLYGVRRSGWKVGDDAAVLGAGPIGLSVLFSVVTGGARRVVVSDLLEERVQMARRLGADVAVVAAGDRLEDAVGEMTGGQGVDIAYDAAGKSETFRGITRAARIGGKAVIFGIPSDDRLEMDAHLVRRKELEIVNVRRSCFCAQRALDLMRKTRLPFGDLITHRFPAERVDEAVNLVADYRDGVIKAVIHF